MEVIGVTASIAQLIHITTKTIKYLNNIKDSSRDRASLLQESSTILPLLVTLQAQINDAKIKDPWFDCVRSLSVEHGPLDQLRCALEQLVKRLKPKAGIHDIARRFVWTLDKAYCQDVLGEIERVKSRISLALQGDTFKLAQAIKADTSIIERVNLDVSNITHGFENLQQREKEKIRRQIQDWFSPLNFFKTQQDIFSRREQGTGEWLILSKTFEGWVSGQDRTLLCPGIPGAGKSILASTVVDHLRNLPMGVPPVGVAAIFFNFKERGIHTTEDLLAALCVQLMQHLGHLPQQLIDLHHTCSSVGARPTIQDILAIFKDIISLLDKAYVVLDALDESSEIVRRLLLQNLKKSGSQVRLLITTRHVDEIIREFPNSARTEIRASCNDLERYISSRIASNNRLARFVQQPSALAQNICKSVISSADGMFLAAKLHLDSLAAKSSIRAIKNALGNLSSSLTDLYDDAIGRIRSQNEDDWKLAKRALQWVAFTYRPLRPFDLQQALSIEPDDTISDPEAFPPVDLVLDVCAGLLKVDEEVKVVRLVHYTAQDYFDALLETRFEEAHASIAQDCMALLSFAQPTASLATSVSDLVFYASTFWSSHAKAASEAALEKQIEQFLAGEPRMFMMTVSEYDRPQYDSSVYYRCQRRCCGPELAAFYGLEEALYKILQSLHDINAVMYNGMSLLHLAAYNDQHSILEILLDHDADINCHTVDYDANTPLHVALRQNSIKSAKVLVGRGADLKALNSEGSTPLLSISPQDPRPFVRLLVDAGAEVTAGGIFSDTPLMHNIISRHDVETLQFLMDYCPTNSEKQINVLSSALVDAASWGSGQIVKMMLDFGADVNSESRGVTPLMQATRIGNTATLMVLLDHGADISRIDDYGRTFLHTAAKFGHGDCLQVLVDRCRIRSEASTEVERQTDLVSKERAANGLGERDERSILDKKTKEGWTALHLAAAERNAASVDILAKSHANVNLASTAILSVEGNSCYNVMDTSVIEVHRGGSTWALHSTSCAFYKRRWLELASYHWLPGNNFRRTACKLWTNGMTALDFALLHGDQAMIRTLKPLTTVKSEVVTLPLDEGLRQIMGLSAVEEVGQEIERRLTRSSGGGAAHK
ncbi:MAG: hypothetical protein Q9220_006383 [cf. Caloplaca sp. 1 TL-2023]